jgi:hypothetical protein
MGIEPTASAWEAVNAVKMPHKTMVVCGVQSVTAVVPGF